MNVSGFHHGCEPQHQKEAGGGRQGAGAEGHDVRSYHLIEWQKVCEAIKCLNYCIAFIL